MSGWISLNRKILKHDIFKFSKDYSRLEAWLWLLFRANFIDKDVCIGNEIYKLKRGQMNISQLKTRLLFGWSNTRLSNFLKLLKNTGSIDYETNSKMTIITILKYDTYQINQYQKNTKPITKTKQKHINNNINKDNKEIIIKLEEFEKFWSLYGKKVGKAKTETYWLRHIKHSDMIDIFNHTRLYNKREKQYRKDPYSYLYNQTWKDEIIANTEFDIKQFKLDATGYNYIGYCAKCNVSDFYKKEQLNGDSSCCSAKINSRRNNG